MSGLAGPHPLTASRLKAEKEGQKNDGERIQARTSYRQREQLWRGLVASIMNKPLAIVCACIAGFGLLILSCSVYCTLAYGHGDPDAGNFHRNAYRTVREPATGKLRREWEPQSEYVASTEADLLTQLVDMWVLGFGLVVLGLGIYAGESASRGYRRGI
jgi:hypothetical protein